MKMKKNLKTLKIGSYSLIISAVVIAVVIALNALVAAIPANYTQFDLTQNTSYELTATSVDFLKTVDEKVTVYLITETGSETDLTYTLQGLVNRYTAQNSNVSLEMVDPAKHPNFISKYTDETLPANSLIVESAKRSTTVSADGMYLYVTEYGSFSAEEFQDYYNYYYYTSGSELEYTYTFFGENNITTAIDYVTTDVLPTLYTLTGHGEAALSETYAGYIASENITLKGESDEAVNLSSAEGIPDDCDAILINLPQKDLSTIEAQLLTSYYDGGGSIILVTDYSDLYENEMTNLISLASKLGLKFMDGVVIERNNRNIYGGYGTPIAYSMLANVNAGAEGGPGSLLTDTSVRVRVDAANGIVDSGEGEGTVYPIVYSSDKAFINSDPMAEDKNPVDFEDGDYEGSVYFGASVEAPASDGTSKFTWFTSTCIVNDDYDTQSSYTNSSVFISSVNWSCSKGQSLSVIGKPLVNSPLTPTESAIGTWSVILIGIIPVAFLGGGFIVWYFRRKH